MIWLVATAVSLVVAGLLGVGRLPPLAGFTALAAIVAGVSLLAWRALDGRRVGATPLAPDRCALAAFAGGAGVGVLLVAGVVGILAALGAFRVAARACEATDQGGFALRLAGLFLVAAVFEEVLFRGYPLFALVAAWRRGRAIAVTSVLFALAHAGNPHYGVGAALVVALIGAALALVVLQEGTVWGAVGIHAGWNWTLAAGAALPVSGVPFASPCWLGVMDGPTWLTGGGFGVEAGVAAAAAWALFGVGRWRRPPAEARRDRP